MATIGELFNESRPKERDMNEWRKMAGELRTASADKSNGALNDYEKVAQAMILLKHIV